MDTLLVSPRDIACGAVETVETEGEWTFHRFSPRQALAYREAGNEDFYRKTFASAGVRLAFRTDAASLSFDYRFGYGSSRPYGYFDVYAGGALVAHIGLEKDDGERHVAEAELDPGAKNVEIYLPWSRSTFLSPLRLAGASFVEPLRRKWTMICFGDSITQGYDALYPSLAYTEAIGRFLDADVVNKAIGGDRFFPGLLDEPDASEPDFVTVAYATNAWRHRGEDEIRGHAKAFYAKLAALYPSARIFALTPLWRKEVASHSPLGRDVRCVDAFIRDACAGLANVTPVPGDALVPHLPEFFSDGYLHPNDMGFCLYAQNLQRLLRPFGA